MNKDKPFGLADDRDFISGIYNYCDRWCEKCAFTLRCRVYADEAADRDLDDPEVRDLNNAKFWRKLESVFKETHRMIAEWAEEQGIDLESIDATEAIAEHNRRERHANTHQVSVLARQYAATVQQWFQEEYATAQHVHDDMAVESGTGEEIGVAEAAEVIRWYQFFIAAKVIRALFSRAGAEGATEEGEDIEGADPFADAIEEDADDDELTAEDASEDGNGSAKIALIAISRSMAAWQAMEMSLPEKSDSIAPIVAELERLRWLTEQAFPDARAFIRPGFDEAATDLIS